jgi:NADPH:quinone reductase-like Zn-dependent oxidoreductase
MLVIRRRLVRVALSRYSRCYRALAFEQPGAPEKVLQAVDLPDVPPLASQVQIKFLLSPVNPSDINVIEKTYPLQPHMRNQRYYVPGNEGLAEVVQLGSGISGLNVGDWVIMKGQQLGTWASHATVSTTDVIPLPSFARHALSPAHIAMISVNPPTALRLLSDYVHLKEGDWVVQNAANSAVCYLTELSSFSTTQPPQSGWRVRYSNSQGERSSVR